MESKAAGKKIAGKMTCHAKAKALAAPVDAACLTRAEAKFGMAFSKLGAACPGAGNSVEDLVDQCVGTLLGDVPGDGSCSSRSAKVVGRWGRALMTCAAHDAVAPGTFATCDTRAGAKNTDALAKAGSCTAGTVSNDLHDDCVTPLVAALPATATTTTTTVPCQHVPGGSCFGSCGPGEFCGPIGFQACGCLLPTSCSASTYPTCGGDCPAGETCYPSRDPSGFRGCFCSATDVPCSSASLPCGGLACPPGFACFAQLDGCGCAEP